MITISASDAAMPPPGDQTIANVLLASRPSKTKAGRQTAAD
jgi:hypothetical protein